MERGRDFVNPCASPVTKIAYYSVVPAPGGRRFEYSACYRCAPRFERHPLRECKGIFLAKCDVCGKGRQFGRHIRHKASGQWKYRAPKKPRSWKANVQRRRMLIGGVRKRVNICTRCIRNTAKTTERLGVSGL